MSENPRPTLALLRTHQVATMPAAGKEFVQMEKFFEAAPDAMVVVNAAGLIVHVNSQTRTMFGYFPGELRGQRVDILIPQHLAGRHSEHLAQYFSNPQARAVGTGLDLFGRRKDGSSFPVEISLSPIEIDSQLLVVSAIRDVTERKRGEDKFRSFLESSLDAILILDNQGQIAIVNRQAENLFGYSRSELLRRPVKMLAHDLSLKAPTRTELLALRKDGTEFPVEVVLSPLETAEGQLLSCSFKDLSEQKKADELRSRLAALVDSSDDAIIGKDLDGIVNSWNRGAEKIFGYTAEEMLGHSLEVLFPPDRLNEESHILKILRLGHSVDHLETVRRRKDGRLVDISVTISLVRDGSGKITGASKVARDISQRKRAEKQLLQAQEVLHDHKRLRAIFNSAFHFQGLLSPEGILLEANDTALDFAGIAKEEVLGRYFWDTPWWAHSTELQERIREAIREACLGKNVRMEGATHPGPDGKMAYVDFSLRPIFDDLGEVCFLVPEGRDITQERQAQEALADSETRFRQAFELAGMGMALCGLGGRWLQVNSAMCEIVGYSENELLEMNFREMTHPDDLDADNGYVRDLLDGHRGFCQFEKRFVHKSGEIIWILMTASVVRSQSGEPHYFIAQIQDVSSRKRTEQALKVSLSEKEVMLQEIHHRVKNNLQVINSLIQLQSNTLDDPSVLAALRDCQSRVQSMALVHERLYKSGSFARMDFGAHLKELAHLVANSQTASQCQVEMNFRLEPVALSLETAIPVGLIANELISNAFKHAFRGRSSGRLEIQLSVGTDKDEVTLQVDDDGPGLGADFALDDVSATLGLRMIKTLTRQVRGQFLADPSESLGGVRFILIIRLAQQAK